MTKPPKKALMSETLKGWELVQSTVRLEKVLKREMDRLSYGYDLGDDWEHEVVLEKVLPYETSAVLPLCVKGSRACPREDVGGPSGYDAFLEAIPDPGHPEHEEMPEWIGGDFDPEHFDLNEVRDLFSELCDKYSQSIGISAYKEPVVPAGSHV
jgi:hypothetical protein